MLEGKVTDMEMERQMWGKKTSDKRYSAINRPPVPVRSRGRPLRVMVGCSRLADTIR